MEERLNLVLRMVRRMEMEVIPKRVVRILFMQLVYVIQSMKAELLVWLKEVLKVV